MQIVCEPHRDAKGYGIALPVTLDNLDTVKASTLWNNTA
jgi:hypothetical protein